MNDPHQNRVIRAQQSDRADEGQRNTYNSFLSRLSENFGLILIPLVIFILLQDLIGIALFLSFILGLGSTAVYRYLAGADRRFWPVTSADITLHTGLLFVISLSLNFSWPPFIALAYAFCGSLIISMFPKAQETNV